jgi:uncharacterized damage-inducible protein DinB
MSKTDLSYPIGKFSGEPVTPANRSKILLEIAELPGRLRDAVEGLSEAQLDTPYRPEGWTVRQVVHHIADANLHAFVRTRYALTMDKPTIMPFDEVQWANLKDASTGPVEPSLVLLEGLHARWSELLDSLNDSDWERVFVHPEGGPRTVAKHIASYAHHGRHHTAHITELRKRMGWT